MHGSSAFVGSTNHRLCSTVVFTTEKYPHISGLFKSQLYLRKYLGYFSFLPSRIMSFWASLVAQWLRVCLPMQGTRVRALVWEDPTCRGVTKPVSHNC